MLAFSSCKKDSLPVNFQTVSSGTDEHLYAVKRYSNDTLVACGGKEGIGIILLSGDNGNTWKTLNNSFDKIIYDIQFINRDNAFALCEDFKLFRSNDFGTTWAQVYLDSYPTDAYQGPFRKIFFVNDSIGYMCGGKDRAKGFIYKTTDGGHHWEYRTFDHELRNLFVSGDGEGAACGYGALIATTDGVSWNLQQSENEFYTGLSFQGNSGVLCGYEGGLFFSSDYGKSWSRTEAGNDFFTTDRIHYNCIRFFSGGLVYACGNNGAIAKSTDGGKSYNIGHSFNESAIYDIVSLNSQEALAVGSNGNIFRFGN